MKIRVVSEKIVRTERILDVDFKDFNIEPDTPTSTAIRYISFALQGYDIDSIFNDDTPPAIKDILDYLAETVPDYEETTEDIILRAERVD